VAIWLRTEAPSGGDDHGDDADIVIDLRDPCWPVIRHAAAAIADRHRWYVSESRAFYGPRAETWDTRFGDDLPAYAAAVTDAVLPAGATVLDVGCGTGRALPALRNAVGPTGIVIGADITPEMLAVAQASRRNGDAVLLLADARHLPLADNVLDAVFAAGLITHLPDIPAGLVELARVTRVGGRLVIFHPSGRAAVAARHGRQLGPSETLARDPLHALLAATGWRLESYEDPPHRFLAIATRR